MAIDYVMPKLAMGMNEGTVLEWLAQEGQYVERGAPLMQVETEKVVYDVEAPVSGWFHVVVAAGTTVPAESLIGRFAASEAEYAAMCGGAAAGAGAAPAGAAPALAIDEHLTSTGVMTPRAPGGRIKASPLARKLARDAGIDIACISGSGPGGRIVKRDVLAATADRAHGALLQRVDATAGAAHGRDRATATDLTIKATVPLKGMRGVIARRMTQSLQTAAQLSQFSEVDATGLLAARANFVAAEQQLGTRVSLNAFFAKAVAVACQQVPIANASIVDDEIVLWNEVHVGFAVALPGQGEWDSGLIVPVLRNAERKGLVQIDRELRDLTARAREGRLAPGETEGGTITLSPTATLGGEDIYAWTTPVLNLPQAVIVQPGLIQERAVVRDGAIVARPMLPLSLTFDHRILDGEPFGRFVAALRRCLQAPELMLA
jgi:pyruvate/2-oxoglutarate dehydrogenase complex dihydrolipoamide acyltransferase (E2) component